MASDDLIFWSDNAKNAKKLLREGKNWTTPQPDFAGLSDKLKEVSDKLQALGIWTDPQASEMEAYQNFLTAWDAVERGDNLTLSALSGGYGYGYGYNSYDETAEGGLVGGGAALVSSIYTEDGTCGEVEYVDDDCYYIETEFDLHDVGSNGDIRITATGFSRECTLEYQGSSSNSISYYWTDGTDYVELYFEENVIRCSYSVDGIIPYIAEHIPDDKPDMFNKLDFGTSFTWYDINVIWDGGNCVFGILPCEKVATGGVLAGGSAAVITGDVFHEVAAGGVFAGGECSHTIIAWETATGGLLAAGEADLEVVQMVGGLVAGGSATVSTRLSGVSLGGMLAGGECFNTKIVLETASGGLVAGGAATLPNFIGFLYRTTLTVPANKLSSDLQSFYVGKVVDLPTELPLNSTFLVTDVQGNIKDHEIRDFDGSSVWIFFRADLSAEEDNEFYLYSGGSP